MLFLCTNNTINAQEEFTVTLRLVKPGGELSEKSYFELTLRNNTENSYLIPSSANGDRETYSSCIAVAEFIQNNNEISIGPRSPIFSFKNGMRIIKPKQTMTLLPIDLFSDDVSGALPGKSKKENLFRQIRFRIEQVKLTDFKNRNFYKKDLYSNWIDISGEDFTSVAK